MIHWTWTTKAAHHILCGASSTPQTSCYITPARVHAVQRSAASRWSNVPFGNCRHIKYSDRHDLHEIQILLQSKTIRSIEPAQGQCDQIWTGHNQSDQMRSNRLNWDQTRLQVSGESGTLKSSQQSKRRRKSELSDLKQRSQSKRRALPVSTKRARFTRGCMETKLPTRRRRLQAEESLTLVHLSCFYHNDFEDNVFTCCLIYPTNMWWRDNQCCSLHLSEAIMSHLTSVELLVINEAQCCCRDAPAYKLLSPHVNKLVTGTANSNIYVYIFFLIFSENEIQNFTFTLKPQTCISISYTIITVWLFFVEHGSARASELTPHYILTCCSYGSRVVQ